MTGPAPQGGVLLTHGDAVTWRRVAGALVASVRVEVGAGAWFAVDAADPATVIAWHLPLGVKQEALDAALGVGWRDALPELGAFETDHAADLRLGSQWARLATVLAIEQRYPLPLEPAAILVDLALAYAGVGLLDRARWAVESAVGFLFELGEQHLSDGLPLALWAVVSDAIALARSLLDDSHEDRAELDRLGEELSSPPDTFDGDLVDLLRSGAGLASVAGTTLRGGGAGPETVLDPAIVPARTLEWRPAGLAPFDVVEQNDTLVVTVRLADGADADDAESRELVAYSAVDDGRPWSSAPLLAGPDGRTLSATLQLHGRPADRCTVGIYGARFAGDVAEGAAAAGLAHARRFLTEAWLLRRVLAVEPALADAPDARPGKPSLERAGAEQSAARAARRGRQRLADTASIDARAVPPALVALVQQFADADSPADPAARPLLAELLTALPRPGA